MCHASAHDKKFLNDALWRTSRIHLTHRVLDTLLIEKWLLPQEQDLTLDALVSRHGVTMLQRHHALDDAIMTAHVYVSQLEQARDRHVHTVGDLYAHVSRVTYGGGE